MRSFSIVGCSILLLLAGCGRSAVVLPPGSASPEDVLDAYLTALQSGNCDGARALATREFADQTMIYCSGVRVTGFRVFANPATPNDNEVVFTLSLTTSGGDETLRDGSHIWFFSLVRQTGGAWRLSGGGTGP